MIKIILSLFLLIASITLSGCYASIEAHTITLTGQPLSIKYVRIGNQNIEGFRLIRDSNGLLTVMFDKQLSETEIAFQLGQIAGVKMGGHSE